MQRGKKNLQFTTPFMDEIRQLANLKQQIITKDDITSQHRDILAMCCKVKFFLRVGECRP